MKLWGSFYIKHTQLVYFLHIYTVPSFYDSLTTRNENNKYNHINEKDNKYIRKY